jgi:RP/EB family microtubule-associated protein
MSTRSRTDTYNVGRRELVEWVNELLGLNYSTVEDTGNGAAFCQVMDVIHPGTVALGRVNFNASTEPERIENYKVLQAAFNKSDIRQYIDVKALCKGRMQAALELLQWIHGYWIQQGEVTDYDGAERRRVTKCKAPSSRTLGDKRPSAGAIPKQRAPPPPPVKSPTKPVSVKAPPKAASLRGAETPVVRTVGQAVRPQPAATQPDPRAPSRQEIARLKEELDQMAQEKEFYFEKLRRVEEICQEAEDDPTITRILDILYETDPERGFLPPEEEDE